MAEVAGLVLGAVALWRSCVQVFEVVDSSRRYGLDYELIRVKLEVERVRLDKWGDAIGLRELDQSMEDLPSDSLLRQNDVVGVVMRLLGCIQHIFDDSERLQTNYGLRPAPQISSTVESPQFLLGSIFAKSYANLRRSGRSRQASTHIARRTLWAIHDKRKFQDLVQEIRGFNDSLEKLFPGSKRMIAEVMRLDVENSADVAELQLLQGATAQEYGELSDCASARLEVLGAGTSSNRSVLLTSTSDDGTTKPEDEQEVDGSESSDGGEGSSTARHTDYPLSEMEKRIEAIDRFFKKKQIGALTLSVSGAWQHSSRVTAHCYWEGESTNHSFWTKEEHGFVRSGHAAFDLYKRKRFRAKKQKDSGYGYDDSEEGATLLDVESHVHYENINAGTMTVEGFALEAWDYEETYHPREQSIWVNHSETPIIPAKKILRRLKELAQGGKTLGWSPKADLRDLKEFTGGMGIQYVDPAYELQDFAQYSSLFSLLNRKSMVDFLSTSSISAEWGGPKGSLWDFLWQIVLAKELARRFEHGVKESYTSGFTSKILASMIVADLWLKHVDIVLEDLDVKSEDKRRAGTQKAKDEAEELKNCGNDALKKKEYSPAIEFYTEALKRDPGNALYRSNRSAAYYYAEQYEDSFSDAHIAVRLDPSYTKAWSRLGLAAGKLRLWKYAIDCYEAAVLLGGEKATEATKTGLKEAKSNDDAQIKAINQEKDDLKQDALHKTYIEQDYELIMRELQLHSLVHEQQVEGLLNFAVKVKWPFVNEVRDIAEEAYSNLRSGQTLPFHLHDWLFGMTLPGHWFSFKVMSALIACTPSIRDSLGFAPSYDCGLCLPNRSYWRIRSVLGRVLGCLPGVISIGGWLGPCPPVEFDPLLDNEPRHVRLRTRRTSLLPHKAWEAGDLINYGEYKDRYEDMRLRADEEVELWMAEMRKATNWIIPEPPVRQVSTCELKSIRLKRDLSAQPSQGNKASQKLDYRAQLVFKMDDSDSPVSYNLWTNPVFTTVPPCHGGPKGEHECHLRELYRYEEKNIWTVERLKDHTEEDIEEAQVMIINATGNGAELLARAWCSERGKHAVIRRARGACFVCAERAASPCGLGVGVLIWVS